MANRPFTTGCDEIGGNPPACAAPDDAHGIYAAATNPRDPRNHGIAGATTCEAAGYHAVMAARQAEYSHAH